MPDHPMTFSQALEAALALRGMTKADLARRARTTRPTVSRLSNGRNRPSFELLRRIVRVLPELCDWLPADQQ